MTNQMVSEADVQSALDWLTRNDEEMAEAHTDAEIVEQKRKVIIAELMKGYEGSAASREMNALADPAYKTFLDGEYKLAIKRDQQLKLKAKALNTKIDVYRTISANQRRGGI